MTKGSPLSPARLLGSRTIAPGYSRAFTLVEVLAAMTIFGLTSVMIMAVYIAVLKRAVHTESATKGVSELRFSSDYISQAVRSASQSPVVEAGGLQLLVPPKDLGYATVLATTWINLLHNVKGSKANQQMLHLSNVTPAAAVASVFSSDSRPAGAVDPSDVPTYFTDGNNLPAVDLNDLFAEGDTLTIPATTYGPKTNGVINNISNNSGSKTLTLNAALGVDVPNGTKILATSGRRIRFSVESNGDLRYYPDHRDAATYTVLARDIDPSPRVNPADSASGNAVPFSISGRVVTLNLQKIPKGTTAGRTVQGILTTVYARTDPLIP